MTEPHPRAEFEQAGFDHGPGGRGADPEPSGGPPDHHRVTGRLTGREQHQAPGFGRQIPALVPEALLDRLRVMPPRAHSAGKPEPARELGRAQLPG